MRGEWIRHVHKTRRGFIRLNIMVDIDTREILACRVTDEQTGEIKVFEQLIVEGLANAKIGRGSTNSAVEEGADGGGAPVGGTAGVEGPAGSAVGEGVDADGAPADGQAPRAELWIDGAYDSRRSFEFCRERGVRHAIRIGTNATTRSRGVGRSRTMAAYYQLSGRTTDPKEFADPTHEQSEANRKEWKRGNSTARGGW